MAGSIPKTGVASTDAASTAGASRPGNQTLTRGLIALNLVADAPSGMTANEVATELGVHRSIAYRLLQTLADHGFVSRWADGTYRGGSRLVSLSSGYLSGLRASALPEMRRLADEIGASVALFIVESGHAVAIEMVQPSVGGVHIAFGQGQRTTLERGAAAYALGSMNAPQPDEPAGVTRAREFGYARSFDEIEQGANAVAAPIPGSLPPACLNLITHLRERAESAGPSVVRAAQHITESLE